jgi:hypothetical protein
MRSNILHTPGRGVLKELTHLIIVTSARTSEEELEGSKDITDLLTGSTALACGSRESRVPLLSNSTGRCVSLAVSHSQL